MRHRHRVITIKGLPTPLHSLTAMFVFAVLIGLVVTDPVPDVTTGQIRGPGLGFAQQHLIGINQLLRGRLRRLRQIIGMLRGDLPSANNPTCSASPPAVPPAVPAGSPHASNNDPRPGSSTPHHHRSHQARQPPPPTGPPARPTHPAPDRSRQPHHTDRVDPDPQRRTGSTPQPTPRTRTTPNNHSGEVQQEAGLRGLQPMYQHPTRTLRQKRTHVRFFSENLLDPRYRPGAVEDRLGGPVQPQDQVELAVRCR